MGCFIEIMFIAFLLFLCYQAMINLGIFGFILSFILLRPLFIVLRRRFAGVEITNYKVANEIISMHPNSHRLMQDIIVKIDTSRGCQLDLTEDIGLLVTYLKKETAYFGNDQRQMVLHFFDLFAKAYPNWQHEYQILGKEFERYFGN